MQKFCQVLIRAMEDFKKSEGLGSCFVRHIIFVGTAPDGRTRHWKIFQIRTDFAFSLLPLHMSEIQTLISSIFLRNFSRQKLLLGHPRSHGRPTCHSVCKSTPPLISRDLLLELKRDCMRQTLRWMTQIDNVFFIGISMNCLLSASTVVESLSGPAAEWYRVKTRWIPCLNLNCPSEPFDQTVKWSNNRSL